MGKNGVAEKRYKIVQLYQMGMSGDQIFRKLDVSFEYIIKVIEEFVTDGTITVNSRMNKLKHL